MRGSVCNLDRTSTDVIGIIKNDIIDLFGFNYYTKPETDARIAEALKTTATVEDIKNLFKMEE